MQVKTHIKRIIFVLVIISFIAVVVVFARKETILTGRTINAKGKPIAADIHIPCGDLILTSQSQDDGFFKVTYPDACEGVFWVTSKIDWQNCDYPFSPGLNLPSQYYKKYKLLELLKDNTQEKVDLGEVPVQIYYGKIKVLVDKNSRAKVLDSEDDLEIRMRDKQGNVLSEGSVNRGINKQESSINISLPYETYKIEIKNSNFDWQPLVNEITISKPEPISVKFTPSQQGLLDSANIKLLSKLSKSSAIKELKKKGLLYTTQDFSKSLINGNLEAVILYLRAGMSANERFKDGLVPLMFAAEYPEIIRILIDAGANSNLKSDNVVDPLNSEEVGRPSSEETPLLWAVYKDNLKTLILLLQNGAIVNDIDAYGDSPLSVAVENGRENIIKELLKFGANPNIRGRDGKLLVEIAKERSDWDIVELIEKALENQK